MMNNDKIFPIRKNAEPFKSKKVHSNTSNSDLSFCAYFQGFISHMVDRLIMYDLKCSCYVLVKLRDFWYHKICTENADVLSWGFDPIRECVFVDKGGDYE